MSEHRRRERRWRQERGANPAMSARAKNKLKLRARVKSQLTP